jgi:hypothetical protein
VRSQTSDGRLRSHAAICRTIDREVLQEQAQPMRGLLSLIFVVACSHSALSTDASDLAGTDAAPRDLAGHPDLSRPDFAGQDLAGISCVTGCNHCVLGGACCPGAPNSGCCNSGEWCDNGTCRCGSGSGCAMGQMCAAPVVAQNQCGFICCGNGTPCPK